MENKTVYNSSVKLRFYICSIIGVFLFFVTIPYNGNKKVPMVHIMDIIQNALGPKVQYIFVMVSCLAVLAASIYVKYGKNVPNILKSTYQKDNLFSYFTYITAAVFSVMAIFQIGPAAIIDPEIGETSLSIAADSFFAIMVAGTLVAFITEFGFLEFLGKLLEPIMRRVYKVPGKSAVDAISSFVAAPAAGVMITNDLYQKKVYTARESSSITTNFSIASLGGFAFLSSIAGIENLYSEVVLAAFICVFVLAAVMIRIPPLSRKPDTYIDGSVQTEAQRKPEHYNSKTFPAAYQDALEKSSGTKFTVFLEQLKSSFMFGIKVNAFIVSLSVICLLIFNYTPIAKWIAIPMAPILSLLGLQDAQQIAASSIVGIFALSIPATLIKGKAVAAASAFFVVVLSTSQIIFFTESANAMLESDIPVGFGDLVKIFFIRTIILIPMVALMAKILV